MNQLEVKDGVKAVMKTNMGDMEFVLFPEVAPKAVENFVTHSENGYYDGLIFHRVIQDFMIQGGDPTGTGMGGESVFGNNFEDEFSLMLATITERFQWQMQALIQTAVSFLLFRQSLCLRALFLKWSS